MCLRLPFAWLLACALACPSAPAGAAPKRVKHAISLSRHAHKNPATNDTAPYGQREDVLKFADDVAERRGLDAAWVRSALAAARLTPSVAKLIMPPPAGTAKNWAAYRARFVDPVRIRAGIFFWQANEAWLTLAEQRYGVPPAIVVGIVGVETIYGQQMGGYRVVDALATLSFDFPAGRKDRSAFFRAELEQYLVLCQREAIDPLALRGSYAGAMGMPQFMPSSANTHAVDFDGDGRIDLQASAADAIGSVAHYLAAYGWQRGEPTHFEVAAPVDSADRAFLLGPDIVPTFGNAEFARRGARLGAAAAGYDGPLALVELQNGEAAPSYVAGTANFYAITRYNWSSYYALAVIELGSEVMRRVNSPGQAQEIAPIRTAARPPPSRRTPHRPRPTREATQATARSVP